MSLYRAQGKTLSIAHVKLSDELPKHCSFDVPLSLLISTMAAAANQHMRRTYGQTSATVAQETTPYSPSELVLVPQQPSPVRVNIPPQQTMNVPTLLRCRCNRFVCMSSCISFPCTIIAAHTSSLTLQGSTGHSYTLTGCQFHLRWTTVPVQESLRGYEGPSALAC